MLTILIFLESLGKPPLEIFQCTCTAQIGSLKSVSSIFLTSDIWSSNAKEDYLSFVANYVFADWELEKRVTELRLIDVSHSGINIVERIEFVVYDPVWFEGQDLLSHLIMPLLTLVPCQISFLCLLVNG